MQRYRPSTKVCWVFSEIPTALWFWAVGGRARPTELSQDLLLISKRSFLLNSRLGPKVSKRKMCEKETLIAFGGNAGVLIKDWQLCNKKKKKNPYIFTIYLLLPTTNHQPLFLLLLLYIYINLLLPPPFFFTKKNQRPAAGRSKAQVGHITRNEFLQLGKLGAVAALQKSSERMREGISTLKVPKGLEGLIGFGLMVG